MKKYILFAIFVLAIKFQNCSAQNKLSLDDGVQKQLIIFLIEKQEIDDTVTNWKHYFDAVGFREIFKNTIQEQTNEVFIFFSKSPHASYFLLLKESDKLQILNCNSLNDDMSILLSFFKKNVSTNKHLLEIFTEINEVYLHNQSNGERIPVLPK